jgi:hypothetical protein
MSIRSGAQFMVTGFRQFRAIPPQFETDEHEGRQFEDTVFSCGALLQPKMCGAPVIF